MVQKQYDVTDLTDEKYVSEWKQEKKAEAYSQFRDRLMMKLLESEEARIFLGMLITSCGLMTNSHVNSNTKQEPEPNPLQMSFLEGRRFIGEMIYTLLHNLNPDEEYAFECLRQHRNWLKKIDYASGVATNNAPNKNII